MKHDRAIELISESVFRPLDETEHETLDSHLESCAECTTLLVAYRELWDDVGWAATPDEKEAQRIERKKRARARLLEGIREVKDGVSEESDSIPHRSRSRSFLPALRVAAVVALFAGGVLLGRNWTPIAETGVDDVPHFFLLIRNSPMEDLPPEDAERLSSDFLAWLERLEDEKRIVSSARLAESIEGWVGPHVEPPLTAGLPPRRGFMVIRAADFEEARRIASTSPTLAYGGVIEVLPVR